MKIVAAVVALLVALSSCSSQAPPAARPGEIIIAVNAPFRLAGLVARQIANGAQLAVDEINAAGGVTIAGAGHRLRLTTMDSELSPTVSADNVRAAVGNGAVAIVDEGTGVDASWQAANRLGVPIGIVYQGGEGLVNATERPNVYRIAPTNRGLSFRLAEHLVPKGLRIAVVHDDSQYGLEGAVSLGRAFSRNRDSVTATIRMPATSDAATEVRRARSSGATALLAWARPAALAAIVRAARSSGWKAPIYTSTTGEDPILRQQLADHPEWMTGLVFAGSRLTAEKGPVPFETFRAAYEKRFGEDLVGVEQDGKQVVQPPDWAMYPYDFVRVLAKALTIAGRVDPGPRLLRAMNDADIQGANGDERGFNERNHEGVVDDDVFFARFDRMIWKPVSDDPLSASLPPIRQTRA